MVKETEVSEFEDAFANSGREMIPISLEKVDELIKNQQLDIITLSTIASILIKRGYLVRKR